MDLKQPKTYDEQIQILKDHKLIIDDEERAKKILQEVGYYRFTGYAIQFRLGVNDSTYKDGTLLSQIADIYDFDTELRRILKNYLEIIEVFFRNKMSYRFSLIKCSTPPHDQHYDENNYYNKQGFNDIMNGFNREESNYYKDSLIVKHHNAKYNGKMPLWAMTELLSFSKLSMLYSAMYYSEQNAIAKDVGVKGDTLKNHLHAMSVLRNKCAHAARLFNTTFNPPVHLSERFLKKNKSVRTDSLFAYIVVLLKRLPNKNFRDNFRNDICSLVSKYAEKVDISSIGFPENYQEIFDKNMR